MRVHSYWPWPSNMYSKLSTTVCAFFHHYVYFSRGQKRCEEKRDWIKQNAAASWWMLWWKCLWVHCVPPHSPSKHSGPLCSLSLSQMDHDPRNPTYISAQGPLPTTVADFWQVMLISILYGLSSAFWRDEALEASPQSWYHSVEKEKCTQTISKVLVIHRKDIFTYSLCVKISKILTPDY